MVEPLDTARGGKVPCGDAQHRYSLTSAATFRWHRYLRFVSRGSGRRVSGPPSGVVFVFGTTSPCQPRPRGFGGIPAARAAYGSGRAPECQARSTRARDTPRRVARRGGLARRSLWRRRGEGGLVQHETHAEVAQRSDGTTRSGRGTKAPLGLDDPDRLRVQLRHRAQHFEHLHPSPLVDHDA